MSEISKSYATNYSDGFESRIESNLTVEPIMQLSIIPPWILIVSKKPDGRVHLEPPMAWLASMAACYQNASVEQTPH
jgi:hypothetical protein